MFSYLKEIRSSFVYSDDFIKSRGGYVKMLLRQSRWIQIFYYTLKLDVLSHKLSLSWNKSINEAFELYLTDEEKNNENLKQALRKDINKAYWYTKAKPCEYFLFGFRNLDNEQRKAFITDISMLYMLTKTGTRKLHDLELNEKSNFYKLCKPYFHRKVIIINSCEDYCAFKEMVQNVQGIIVKPVSSGCGMGICVYENIKKYDIEQIFSRIIGSNGSWIVEELIKQDPLMASWNSTSVNTIRITTFKDINGIHFHLPFIRTGRAGSVVDNAGRGGIFAIIDTVTGMIISDGYDEAGRQYEVHPDSKIQYKGWQVPQWNSLKEIVTQMHETIMSEHCYIGWDFALSEQGWVVIEGNWGQYVCQQTCTKIGYKQVFERYLNKL